MCKSGCVFLVIFTCSNIVASRTDPDSRRMKSVIDELYDEIEFPEDQDHFGDIAIYRRRA